MLVPVDAEAFGAALDRLAGDKEGAREMGRKGREVALGKYSADQMVDAYLQLYAAG